MAEIGLDLRPLLDPELSGVGTYTVSLARALREIFGDRLGCFVSGRHLPERVARIGGAALARVSWPNPLVNASMRFFGRPRFDALVGAASVVLPNWNFVALDPKTELTLVVHDLSFDRNPLWFSPKQRLWHRAVSPRRLVARADRLIAVSEWTKHDLVTRFGVPSEKVGVIPPVPEAVAASVKPSGILFERFILFVGNVEERKNPLGLIAAFEKIASKYPDLHLVLAGRFGFGGARVLSARRQSAYASRMHFFGYVSPEEKQWLYEHAALFAYPSFYEGFGIPLVEAMRSGVPVLTSNRSSMPEVVNNAGVLVEPGDVSEIALGLDAILSDAVFAHSLRSNSLERAKDFPSTMTPSLRKIFE